MTRRQRCAQVVLEVEKEKKRGGERTGRDAGLDGGELVLQLSEGVAVSEAPAAGGAVAQAVRIEQAHKAAWAAGALHGRAVQDLEADGALSILCLSLLHANLAVYPARLPTACGPPSTPTSAAR